MKLKECIESGLISSGITGDFNDLSCFGFNGVYVIYDMNEEVVYIGSGYTQLIGKRLEQNINKSSGGTLRDKIKAELMCSIDEAIDHIKKEFNIFAIKYDDLEVRLIEKIGPKYNTRSK